MSRRPNVIPSQQLNVALSLDLYMKLSAHLYSELEQRVPFGAYSRFISQLLRQHFSEQRLDLAPFLDCAPETLIINGSPEAIATLKRKLA